MILKLWRPFLWYRSFQYHEVWVMWMPCEKYSCGTDEKLSVILEFTAKSKTQTNRSLCSRGKFHIGRFYWSSQFGSIDPPRVQHFFIIVYLNKISYQYILIDTWKLDLLQCINGSTFLNPYMILKLSYEFILIELSIWIFNGSKVKYVWIIL